MIYYYIDMFMYEYSFRLNMLNIFANFWWTPNVFLGVPF